ncbi:MAG TPA: hypothetical protein DD381_11535 [Lentisphaeria bacterium]|nr:MAG: hypothetical protein A2X47_10075 [Lentisphaerae bacterium GWF2_38_69]HBM16960.1 hypothetical protein [Lentisphaeria bacterium]
MNSYTRYINTVKGLPVDFIPRVPILMHFASEYIGASYKQFASDHNVLAEANIRCAEDFGFDQLSCICDSSRETHGFGAEVTYLEETVPKATYLLEETKNLNILKKPNPYKSERMFDQIQAVKLYNEKYKGQYSILGWVEGPASCATELRTMTNFAIDLIDDPPFTEDLMDLCTDVEIEFALAQVKEGCDTIGVGDAVASQVSPDLYNNLILPREKKLIKAIQDAGAYVKLHICGNITHLLPCIAELNVDLIDIDHMVDVAKVREYLGKKVVITGNLDPVQDILFGKPEKIMDGFRRVYEKAGNPYMINAGCEIPPKTPFENLKALCTKLNYSSN